MQLRVDLIKLLQLRSLKRQQLAVFQPQALKAARLFQQFRAVARSDNLQARKGLMQPRQNRLRHVLIQLMVNRVNQQNAFAFFAGVQAGRIQQAEPAHDVANQRG